MKKLFISTPTKDRTAKQIMQRKLELACLATEQLKEIVEVIDSYVTDKSDLQGDSRGVWYLGKSLELLATADYVMFDKEWQSYRGCKIEYEVAKSYNKTILVEKCEYKFNAEDVKNQLVEWLRYKFNYGAFKGKNLAVAISGGKDSTTMAYLGVEALGKDRVKGILLPQHDQSDIGDSLKVVNNLGIEYVVVNIGDTVDSVIEEFKKQGITPSTQALTNIPARQRMVDLYFYAQCFDAIPSCNCNLSEDWVGYATYGGDGFGSFGALSKLTVTEVKQIAKLLGVPKELYDKTPSDGLCGKSDEDNLGFTYAVLDKYIRTGEIDDLEAKKKIDRLHEANLFKLRFMDTFTPVL